MLIAASYPSSVRAEEAGAPSLSNGFIYGMTPAQVATQMATIKGVKSAKVSGNKRYPRIKVVYANDTITELGFSFTFDFEFDDSSLVWVDLVGEKTCANSTRSEIDNITNNFARLYGPPSSPGIYHARGTDIYILTSDDTPKLPPAPDGVDLVRYKADVENMIAQCPEASYAHVLVRYKGNVTATPRAIDPAVSRAAIEAQAAKEKADNDALSLPR